MDDVEVHKDWIADGKLPPLIVMANKVEQPFQVELQCLELSTFCPITKQPDYGTLSINYIPKHWCVETKSLKEYLVAYRDKDMFQEEIPNQVLHDLWQVLQPQWLQVVGTFNVRGGICEIIRAERED